MYRSVELFYEPERKCRKKTNNGNTMYSEMTLFQQAFLCGLIREKKPKKIVEIGVAAGGTTSVILEAIELLNLETKVYSVDISEKWYRTGKRNTGFLIEDFYKECDNHFFYLGKSIPFVIEEIGNGIDMLILDTTHSLPGELLDFMCCYPFLNENCTVILHDVAENLLTGRDNEVASKLLFDIIKADKWYMVDAELNMGNQSNIAAFQLNSTTKESIPDLFSALSLTWSYYLKKEESETYLNIIGNYYDTDRRKYLSDIISVQQYVRLKKQISSHYRLDEGWLKLKWANEKKSVYLYGAGVWAKKYMEYAKYNKLPVKGAVVSDDQDINTDWKEDIPVIHLEDLKALPDECIFILALDQKYFPQIRRSMMARGYYDYM